MAMKLLAPGHYFFVSLITGAVISGFQLGQGSKPDAEVSLDVPDNTAVIRNTGISMARGRKVSELVGLHPDDVKEVAEAMKANAEKRASKSSKAEAKDALPAPDAKDASTTS